MSRNLKTTTISVYEVDKERLEQIPGLNYRMRFRELLDFYENNKNKMTYELMSDDMRNFLKTQYAIWKTKKNQ